MLLLLLPMRLQRDHVPTGLLPERVNAEHRVLFVCVENAGRSLMAEAIFNASAPEGWVAESAGTRPAARPNPRTARFLDELGLALPPHPPQSLSTEQMDHADRVVTMGCLEDAACPANLKQRDLVDWALPDPAPLDDAGFRGVRDEIRRRVAALVAELRDRPDGAPAGRVP
ncbi:MAG TPA: low molecular weight phosphatase family protein [Thermoplasmata archaeon]|nr:low molecular weight phosphatase family protein [Thermoplasmata archaeon]